MIQLANLTIHISSIIHNWYCFQVTTNHGFGPVQLPGQASPGLKW